MPTSLYDLPPEILYAIADLVQSRSYDSSVVKSCASSCRLLRAIFRPFVWSRLEISELYARSAPRADKGKGKRRAVEGVRHGQEKQGPGGTTEQPANDCRAGASVTGSSDGVCAAADPPFTRALTTLDDILATSPEIATYVKELEVYLPNEDGLGVPSRAEDAGEAAEGSGYIGEWNERGWETRREERLFPRIAKRLTNLRRLCVSVGSLQCQRRCPPRFRIDWDVLSPGLRSGFTTLFRGERLEEVSLNCVVVPPRMLFGLGIGTGSGVVLGRLKKLELDSYWCISTKRLQQIENFANDSPAFPRMSVRSSLEDSLNAFQATSPVHSAIPTSLPIPALTSLHLGFCDSEFLRYISVVYPDAFMGLKSLSLNIIEKDLGWCQGFLDVIAAGSTTSLSTLSTGQGSTHGLESFDCTIRCNTQASYLGLFTLHALDFSRCSSLRHLSLKYLLISQVTEAVKRAMEVNVATALSAHHLQQGPDGEAKNVEGMPHRKGVETMHLVVDWSFNGDLILLGAFKDLDRVVEEAYYTSSNGDGYRKRKSLNLEAFKIEATHSPCPDAGSCRFRKEVTSVAPPLTRLPSMSGSPPSPALSSSQALLSRRPTPLRTSSSPHPYRGVGAHDPALNEGTLAKFFPFLTSLQGLEDGVDFESRYVLEHRMEFGPGIMM